MAAKKKQPDASQGSVLQWKDEYGKEKFLAAYNTSMEEALAEIRPIFRSLNSNVYENVYSPNMSIRDEFNRDDYDNYRVGEKLPTDPKGKIQACLDAYEKSGYGIVKNIVDLMADFTVQGIDVAYPDKKKEAVVRFWFNRIVGGPERSKRFANLVCKASNIIVKRDTAKIPLNVIRKMYKSTSEADVKYVEETVTTEKRELPVNYTFLHPLTVEPISPELSMFVNSKQREYGLRIPPETKRKIEFPNEEDKALIAQIPANIIEQVRKGNSLIKLDKDKVSVYFYNKDDWQVWATPMIFTVLSDLRHLEKLKLADLAALDGAISQIRIWKLGDIEKGIKVTAAGMAALSNILMNAVGGGFLDLVWAEDLQFQEVGSNVYNFLGEAKYVAILNAIYTGLGIPPLFTGSSNQGSFTNNYIAIKTMIERLESIRNLIKEFWTKELEIVAKALDLDEAITLTFDRMTLNDESSILQIMLHLVDRGYLSIESMQEMVGANPEIEDFRIKREWKEQDSGKRPPKASQFHKAEWKQTWIDSFIKLGEITPSQVGLELPEPESGEIPPAVRKEKVAEKTAKLKKDMGGRPIGKKDATKRKQKVVKPRKSVSDLIQLTAWATDTQQVISEVATPAYLKSVSKKNLRQLTEIEFLELERFKFSVLASISPFTKSSNELVSEVVCKEKLAVPEQMDSLLKEMVTQYSAENEITVDKVREFQAIVYAAYNMDVDE